MKVLLIDDHSLFRDALSLLLKTRVPGLEVHHAGSLAEALQTLAGDPTLKLALLDLTLPDSTGVEAVRRLKAAAEHVTVVVISADERPETVLEAIDAGATSFIPKTARKAVLDDALVTVFDGGVYVPQQTLTDVAPLQPTADELDLSPRQLDVLRLLVAGKSNKLICRELDLSESTVKTHLLAIFRKLDVENRTQAVVAAARIGLRLGA
jgi:DNA-binding NarL/FixJ family response regulator